MTFYTVQFLRFIAACLVLLFHLFIVASGYKGVDIFFIISGFVMYYTLFAKKRARAVHFIVNRTTKIYFLYWVALIFLFFVEPGKYGGLNFKNIFLVPGHLSLLGVSWSLSFELYFYCLVGGCAYLLPEKFHKPLFFLLIGITSVITIIDLFTPKLQRTPINYLLGPNFWEFLLGILCAHLALTYHGKINKKVSLATAIICLTVFCIVNVVYMSPVSYIIYGPLSFLIVMFFVSYEHGKPINKKMAAVFKVLGDSSYAIYLLGPVITLIFLPAFDIAMKIKVILITITVSILFNQFVENPFLSWTRKILYKKFPKK